MICIKVKFHYGKGGKAMDEYKCKLQSILDDVESIINDEHLTVKLFLHDLFNLLFWKDYKDGYVDYKTKHELIELLDHFKKVKSGSDEWHSFDDKDAVYAVIEKARKQLGLNEDLPR